ncbi:MAG: hypothetical protein WCT32_05680 [Patescibacteria group bacterium]|jgi:hypothetical protein
MITLVQKTKAAMKLSELLNQDTTGSANNLNTIKIFVDRVVDTALDLAGVVAFGYILYGSFMYVTAYGDDSKAENGKKTLYWAIIGVVVVAVAKALVGIFVNALK